MKQRQQAFHHHHHPDAFEPAKMWSRNNGRKRNRNLRGQSTLKSLEKHKKLEGVFVKDLQVLLEWTDSLWDS
jgi:capsule polysaccharide modification protein KpsS